tara:strand:+ start:677 stop:1240 length:564 start_codon:yes stop_codon:yes gene_type:complete
MTSIIKVDTLQTAAGGVPTAGDLGLNVAGTVLQVVSATKTNTQASSVASGGEYAVSGLSVNITPTSSTSKFLLIGQVSGARNGNLPILAWLFKRDSTSVGIGDASSNRGRITSGHLIVSGADANSITSVSGNYLDSPSTTSQITYSISGYNVSGATRSYYINYAPSGADDAGGSRQISTLTVMEIAG